MFGWLRRRRLKTADIGGPWDLEGEPPTAEGAPIRAWLDAVGLPWRESRAKLIERFGVRRDPNYAWEVIEVATAAPIAPGLIGPLSAQAFPGFPMDAPATGYSAAAWLEPDARRNLARTAEALAAALGPAAVGRSANVVTCGWRQGSASVRLTAWPADLQSDRGSIPAWEREPRLADACHIHIDTGWRAPLTDAERAAIKGFVEIAAPPSLRGYRAEEMAGRAAAESELDVVRAPEAGMAERLFGRIGLSADGATLIACADQLRLVPMAEVLRLEVDRLLPAKGGGGSTLRLVRRGWNGAEAWMTLAEAPGPDDLNALADRMGAAMGRPVAIGEAYYDV